MNVVIIDNQITHFRKLKDKISKSHTVFPYDENDYHYLVDLIRIYLNYRVSVKDRSLVFKEILNFIEGFRPQIFVIDNILVGNHTARKGIDLAKDLYDFGFVQPKFILSRDKNRYHEWRKVPTIREMIEKGVRGKEVLSNDYIDNVILKEYIEPLKNIVDNQSRIRDLIERLNKIPSGKKDKADKNYENIMNEIIEEIFDNELENIVCQSKMDDGLQVVDITADLNLLDNNSIFNQIKNQHNDIKIHFFIAEVKNYSDDIKNPQVEQLANRFNDQRGRFGFLFCRNIIDVVALHDRIRIPYEDHKYIICFTDKEIIEILLNKTFNELEHKRFVLRKIKAKINDIKMNNKPNK